jgi:PilZ domain-containing protein
MRSGGGHGYSGAERRRHFRVEGEWPVRVDAVEHGGAVTSFDGTAFNISMSGVLLEAAVDANLWVNKQLVLHLPGEAGPVAAYVRRFIDYGEGGRTHTRWGIEFADLTVEQRARWARYVFGEANRLGQEAARRAFEERHDDG